ncbi:hypothetical protein F4680DRAFT_399813 [Xylaria scruposa]|nr:hypothetical protein F4680DRAFT_399813 [Xylaria scruposa]
MAYNSRQQLPEPRCPLPHYTLPTANSSARRRALKSTSPSYSSSSTSLLSKPRSPPSKITPSYYPYVADTNPERTARLWRAVMSAKLARTAGSVRITTRITKSAGSTPTQTTVTQPTAADTDAGIKPKTAKVTDEEFATEVLCHYGITIESTGDYCDKDHFSFMRLSDKSEDRLQAYKKKLPHVTIWVENVKEGDVQDEYFFMRAQRCNEAEFSRYALSTFFLEEQRRYMLGGERWVPYRTVKLVQKPEVEWVIPPILDGIPARQYDWNYRTDVTYWAPSEAFHPNSRNIIPTVTSQVHERGICPYLTIEFKKDDLEDEVAQCQVAVAAAMSLYNRHRLKCRMLQATGQRWSSEDKSQMRHYGITFAGSKWVIWCIQPKRTQKWDGCKMKLINIGDCCTPLSISRLIRFINDIHYWGLAVHGQSCKDDILAIRKAESEALRLEMEEAIDVSVIDISWAE